MEKDDLLLIDENKSVAWNYVSRIDYELEYNHSAQSVLLNNLIPYSYRKVIGIITKACNFSRTALLLNDEEDLVAFTIIVDDSCLPFLLDELDDVVTPMMAVYKIFYENDLARVSEDDKSLSDFIANTVIEDINNNFESWKSFKYDAQQII